MRLYENTVMGSTMNPIPTNISSKPSVVCLSGWGLRRVTYQLTSKDVARRILSEVYVARDRTSKVANADLQSHTHPTLVVPCKIVPKPISE